MFIGIINYNDHLNLCHFTDRKYVCHYCHEGFEREYDKVIHENEHIGITKFATSINNVQSNGDSLKKASNTQTEPSKLPIDLSEEKLKKLVSFYDKIIDNEKVVDELTKKDFSDTNSDKTVESESTEGSGIKSIDTRTEDKSDFTARKKDSKILENFKCHICGELFDCRHQLNMHVNLEHRVRDKFSKFHSCAGLVNRSPKKFDCTSENGTLKLQSLESGCRLRRIETLSSLAQNTSVNRNKSLESLSYDPSTNIVYYHSSMESMIKNNSALTCLNTKLKNCNYKWEPGTKIIHV